MDRVRFGRTGLEVSRLGIGTSQNREVVTLLLDAGANVVDTAQCYGDHERFLGETVSHRRAEFVLVSKCGHHEVLPDGRLRSRPISMHDIDAALERLRTDHLDAMLLHSYDRDLLERGEAVEVLLEARRAGKIRFAGYSGDNETAEVAAAIPGLDVLEVSVSAADQRNIDRLLRSGPVPGAPGTIAKRPIANAAWRWMGMAPDQIPDGPRPYAARLAAMGLDPAWIDACAGGWAEFALRFNLSVPGLHTSIIGTGNPENARANLAYAARGPLPEPTFAAVRAAFASAEAAAGGWPALN